MTLGHHSQVGGVDLSGLLLDLLVDGQPAWQLAGGGCRRQGDRSGCAGCRMGRASHVHRDLDRHLDGLRDDDRLGGRARGVRPRQRRGAALRRVRATHVGAVHRHGHPGLLAGGRILLGDVAGPQRRVVQGVTSQREGAEAVHQLDAAVDSAAVQRDGEVGAVAQAGADEPGEDVARADLDERVDAGVGHGDDLLGEAHRACDLARQDLPALPGVGGVGRGLAVGVDGHAPLGEGRRVECLAEGSCGACHQLGVERRRDREPLGAHAALVELGLHGVQRRHGPRQHELVGAVVVRDDRAGAQLGEQGLELGTRPGHGRHRPLPGGIGASGASGLGGHELATGACDGQRGRLVQDACGRQGRDLAEAVAAGRLGLEPQLPQERQHREADGADGRLGPLGGREPGRLRIARVVVEHAARPDDIMERGVVRREACVAIPGAADGVEGHGEVGAHADVLRTLAGEHEGDPAWLHRAGGVAHAAGQREVLGSPADAIGGQLELALQLALVPSHDGEAMGGGRVERLLPRAREEAEGVGCVRRGGHGLARGDQISRGSRRQQQQLSASDALPAGGVGPVVLLHGEVEVGATEAEGADGPPPQMVSATDPGARGRVEVERAALELQRRLRLGDLDRRRQDLVVDGHDDLDEAGRARGALGVADLGLHRAQLTPGLAIVAGLAQHHLESVGLGDVTRAGAGAVGLDELHGLRAVAGHLVRPAQRAGLSAGAGGVHALGAAVRARADAADDRVHLVSVALRVRQALEQHHADALTEDRAVGVLGERAAVAREGQSRSLREAHPQEGIVGRVDATGDDGVRVAEPQLVDAHRQRGERAGARRVGGAVGAAEVEAVGDAPGHDVAEEARERGLLPVDEVRDDPIADVLDLGLGQACLTHGLGPDRPLQAARHLAEQLEAGRDAEDAAHP